MLTPSVHSSRGSTMHAENFAPYREAAQLFADFTAELSAARAAHAHALEQLAKGPEQPAPMTLAEAAAALIAGDAPPTAGTAMARLQLEEFELRQRLERMTPMAQRLAERVELERVRAREAALAADKRSAELANAWGAAESAVKTAVAIESRLIADARAGALGNPELPRPSWLAHGF